MDKTWPFWRHLRMLTDHCLASDLGAVELDKIGSTGLRQRLEEACGILL